MKGSKLVTTAIAIAAVALIALAAAPSKASAHTVTRSACARAAHADMVANPPHTTQQRRLTFLRCLKYAAQHKVSHQLHQCSKIRLGNAHTRWTVRSACKIMVAWPFNSSDQEAVTVAWCEGTFNPRARNGEYRGTFQMGDGERARWGHGPTIEAQAIAASGYYEYDRDVTGGGGFGPWSCKPGSAANAKAWNRAPRVLKNYVF